MIYKNLVSVIIPAYNHEKFVGETIDSLCAQSYKNIELIILNDGSTDNTDQIIQNTLSECERHFAHVNYINKENEGIIKTLNKGIAIAKGKYIYIIASDDSAEPKALESLHDFLSKNSDYGLAVGDNYIIDDYGERCFWNQKSKNVYKKSDAKFLTFGEKLKDCRKDVDFNSEEFGSYESLLKGNYIPNGYLIRKDILDSIGGYSEDAPLEDYYMMMQISKISKLKFIDKPLFNYRCHSSNTIKQTKKMIKFAAETLMLEEKYARENGCENEFLRALGYKKKFGIPFIFDISKSGDTFKERVIFRILGIRLLSSIKTFDMKDPFTNKKHHLKVIKIIGIPVCKKYEKI
ncbi:MAG: glycosyltransferase family 2 protein [Desulfuromonadales bacterium]|nr:glycosyltransferase family 2 protein [Desulfuromonadales bacterium]